MLVTWHEELGSTNDQAALMAEEGHSFPFVVAARRQAGGRGRAGRVWRSPEGGAWLSVGWRAESDWAGWSLASLAVGLAVRDVVVGLLDEVQASVTIKWPNDVLIGGRKVCGVLCERPWAGRSGGDWLIAGVGLNVNVDVSSLGDDLRVAAASLRDEAGRGFVVSDVVERVGGAVIERLGRLSRSEGPAALLAELARVLAWRGERVRVTNGGGVDVLGVVEGVDDYGHLVLMTSEGRFSLAAGDVERVRLDQASVVSAKA